MPDRYRLVIDAAPLGVILADAGGRIVLANVRAEQMFGYAPGEMLNLPVEALVPDASRGRHAAMRSDFSKAPSPHLIGEGRELKGRRKDGSIVPVEIGLNPVVIDGERFVLAGLVDLTKRHSLERELRQAQRMESMGLLAGGVAHDFNNLLTVIGGSAEMLLDECAGRDLAYSLVTDIQHASQRAAGLTRQLLAFSRRDVVEPRVTSLNTVVTDTEKMLRRLIGEDIEFSTRIDGNAPPVLIDPDQWSQVLINLAVNARDAMPRGGRLAIHTEDLRVAAGAAGPGARLPAGRYARLTMSDTGTGMPPEVCARIFDAFFTTKEKGRGTGLGLSVVHGIVQQSGGDIEVDSRPSAGTTFRISLPAAAGEAAAAAAPVPAATPASGVILLVEDETGVRTVAAKFLRRAGYTVVTATNGDEAIRMLAGLAQPVDLLITDVVMPGADGRTVAEAMRARFPATPVLYTSGYTEEAVLLRGIARSEVAFLTKPYTSRTLLAKVADVLGASG